MPTLTEKYDGLKENRTLEETKELYPIPQGLKERVDRGRQRMKDDASERDEVMQFWRNNQYVYRTPKGYLLQQDRITNFQSGGGKPPHRMRMVRNMVFDLIQHQISTATSRIPSFEVSPATSDPEDEDAAALSEKVALYGYDKWSLRSVGLRMVTLCALTGEGFAWPYFDNTVGPYFEGENGPVGMGEIKVRVFTGNQVAWEPGIRFQDSRWHSVDVAMTEQEVRDLPGFVGGPLKSDADIGGIGKASNAKLVLTTHYLERPSIKQPHGRWFIFANDRIAVDAVDYPCRDGEGKVVDEPVLHYLSYVEDPDNDRNFGLGRLLIDLQRTYNDIWNKLLEWKNLAAIGQLFVAPGLLKRQQITDEPGKVYEIPQPDQNVKERTTPPPPDALFNMLERTLSDMGRIAAQNDIPSQVESGRAIEPLLERDKGRQGSFYENLAEWWSQLMRHCLYLTQLHYSEHDDRILKLQGEWGPDRLDGFKGADLRSQADVRVYAGSLEPRSRAEVEKKVSYFASMGWISGQQAMAAMNGGNAETLIDDYLKDVAWCRRLIAKVVAGPEVLFAEPPRIEMRDLPVTDPMTGQPQIGPDGLPLKAPQQVEVPAWMPRRFHNIAVIKAVMESWLKTRQYERLDDPMREAADQVYAGLEQLESEKAERDAAIQTQVAADLGMQNAARPQDKSMPDRPSPGGPAENITTPNQPGNQASPS